MIYTKQTNFPYPLLQNASNNYLNATFDLDVSLNENQDFYILNIKSEISSHFLINLISQKKARIMLVIKSKDSQFYELPNPEECELKISKNNLSFYKNKTIMQLIIQSLTKISFNNNEDINEFYKPHKNKIQVDKGWSLGFSSIVSFDGSQKNPFTLFEKKLDENIESDIEYRLTNEVITIVYKTQKIMFSDIPNNRNLTNPYLYIGLQKALMALITSNLEQQGDIDEGININNIDASNLSALDTKLFKLLKQKGIEELSFNSLDKVIHLMSDNILGKYVNRVGGLYNHAN